ncbi:hypothetical protein DFJ73DRAFT_759912 [Zopfochytrium polystomum]|nr:hypothetical protein DFJ73DRAFT_759912 [Zopfochytrium polystomum]
MSQPEAPSTHPSMRVQLPPELSSFHAHCLHLSEQPEHLQLLKQISAEVVDQSSRFESFHTARLDWIKANLLQTPSARLDAPATSALLECKDFLERHSDLDEGGKISQAITSLVLAQYRVEVSPPSDPKVVTSGHPTLDSQQHESTTEHAPITRAQYLQLQEDIDEILDRACYEIHKYKKQIPALHGEIVALTANNSRLTDETARLSEENKDLRRRLSAFAMRTPVSVTGSPGEETADIDTPQSTPSSSASQEGPPSTPQPPSPMSNLLLWSSVLQWRWPRFVAPKLDKEEVNAVRNSLSRFWRKHGIPAPGSRYYMVPSHLTDELLAEAAEHAGDILDQLGKPMGDSTKTRISGGGSSSRSSSKSSSGTPSASVHQLEEVEGGKEEEEEDVRGWRPWLDLIRQQWPQFLLHRFEHRGSMWRLVSHYCNSRNLTTHIPSQLFQGKPLKAIPPWLAEDFLDTVTGKFGEEMDSQFGMRARRKRPQPEDSSSSSDELSPYSPKKHKATGNASNNLIAWPDIVRSKWPTFSSREGCRLVAHLAYQFCTQNGLNHQPVLTERKQKSVGIPAALTKKFLDYVTGTAGNLLDKRFPNTTTAPRLVTLADSTAGRGESQAPGPAEKYAEDGDDWVACADLVRKLWPGYLASCDKFCQSVSVAFCNKHNLSATVKSPTTGKWCRAVPRSMERLFLEELLREAGGKMEMRWGPPLLAEVGLMPPEK